MLASLQICLLIKHYWKYCFSIANISSMSQWVNSKAIYLTATDLCLDLCLNVDINSLKPNNAMYSISDPCHLWFRWVLVPCSMPPSTKLSSYPGYFQEPHWKSMGLLEIFRVTWQLCKHLPELILICCLFDPQEHSLMECYLKCKQFMKAGHFVQGSVCWEI